MPQSTASQDPTLAAILSFILPGLGQLYCQRVGSFFAWLLLTVFAYFVFLPFGLILHVVAIVHAFQICQKPLASVATAARAPTIAKAEPVTTNKLFVVGLAVVGILAVVAIVTSSAGNVPQEPSGVAPSPARRSYPWLNQCSTECEQRLGASRMAFIDEQTCETLVAMHGIPRTENQVAWDSAISDKANSLDCGDL